MTLPNHGSVFQAEITAIHYACQNILSTIDEYDIKYVKLLSGSPAAIKALHNTHIKAAWVLETLEYVETLAYRVRRTGKIVSLQPWSNVKSEVDMLIRQKGKQLWICDNRFKHNKLFMDGPNKDKAKGILN